MIIVIYQGCVALVVTLLLNPKTSSLCWPSESELQFTARQQAHNLLAIPFLHFPLLPHRLYRYLRVALPASQSIRLMLAASTWFAGAKATAVTKAATQPLIDW
jgi:hypothetical protein